MLEEMLVEKIAVCWWRQKRVLRCEAGTIWEGTNSPEEFVAYSSRLSLPLHDHQHLDRILRYETTIQRQLAYAMNQLERLQRARKGEHVPVPVSIQVSSDQ